MVPVRPESGLVCWSLLDSLPDSAGLWRTLAGLRGPVKIIDSDIYSVEQMKNDSCQTFAIVATSDSMKRQERRVVLETTILEP